jgi:predicted TIM-barrel fold metal-dependent hydrolase
MSKQTELLTAKFPHPTVREDWLARHQEEILEPALPIIDAHHHLWDRPKWPYLLPDLLRDARGHNVVATVFVQCGAMYRQDGPEELRPVGEVEFVNGVAAMAASGLYGKTRACAAIVGHADLMLGARAEAVLEKLKGAAPDRFRGIRHITAWHPDRAVKATIYDPPPHQLLDTKFQEGFRCLDRLGLSFDAFVYHTQLDDVAKLADAFPHTPIVLNHVGGPVGVGPFAGKQAEVLESLRKDLRALGQRANVVMKIGGLGMHLPGFALHERTEPADSAALAAVWRPYFEACLDAFGPDRCMFESNFPVDKISTAYAVLWNAFKRLAGGLSAADKTALFSGTAARVYRIEV